MQSVTETLTLVARIRFSIHHLVSIHGPSGELVNTKVKEWSSSDLMQTSFTAVHAKGYRDKGNESLSPPHCFLRALACALWLTIT